MLAADSDRTDIADDRERRVVQRVAILIELAVGFVEVLVFVLAFVFPGEAAAVPDVDEAAVALAPLDAASATFTGFSKQ